MVMAVGVQQNLERHSKIAGRLPGICAPLHQPGCRRVSQSMWRYSGTKPCVRKPDVGKSIWSRFSQPREKTLWYYRSLADKFRERWPGQLADELHEIVEALENSPPKS
jgi:hypothetical protein